MNSTDFMTTRKEAAKELGVRCHGEHSPQPLMGDRAKDAAMYPKQLCKRMCRGIKKQAEKTDAGIRILPWRGHEQVYADDEHGKTLDGKKAEAARMEELTTLRAWGGYTTTRH